MGDTIATFPSGSDPVSAFTRRDGSVEAHDVDHGRVINIVENVMRHGADPTGTLDSYAATMAAHAALGNRGGTILYPAGKYKHSTQPVFTKSVKLKGAGIGTSSALASTVLLFDAGVAGPKLSGYGSSVEDMWLEGQTVALGADDGVAVRCQHFSATNVVVKGFGRDGFSVDSTDGGVNANLPTLTNTLAINNKRHGYYIYGSDANAGCFLHAHSFQNEGYGFFVYAATSTFISPVDDGSTLGSFYDDGIGSTWIAVYAESAGTFTMSAASTHGYLRYGAYGAPTVVNNGGAWTVEKNYGARLGPYYLEAADTADAQQWRLTTGLYDVGSLSLTNMTNPATIFVVDKNNFNAAFLIPLTTTAGVSVNIGGELNHDGTTVGFFGHTPSAQPAAYTVTNPTTDRALNVTADTTAQVAQVLGTLIADLQTLGVIG